MFPLHFVGVLRRRPAPHPLPDWITGDMAGLIHQITPAPRWRLPNLPVKERGYV